MRQDGTRNVVGGNASVGGLVQAQTVGSVHFHGQQPPAAPVPVDPWARAVADSPVWRRIPSDREHTDHRRAAVATAVELARLRDASSEPLAEDPWSDEGFPHRFLENLGRLLDAPPPGLDLYPAEAALLVLLPFLHQAHNLRRAAESAPSARPDSLTPEPAPATAPEDERKAFEAFADAHRSLVRRALRRPGAEPAVGWWLHHRRLAQRDDLSGLSLLLTDLGPCARELGEALAPRRVTALLHGLRRGPDVCHPEFLGTLPAEDTVRCISGHQRIRDQRLALIAALAHGMAIEMTALPDIVVEHLATPHPVDLAALRATLDAAHWGGSPELPVLRAECHHEAVVEGLREYAGRVDELLHAVRRTVRERVPPPMPTLPTRLSAHEVAPAQGTFDNYGQFRDEGRQLLNMAMGVQLYKERDLAVRELYQNALDACRYRRARTEYLGRTGGGETVYSGEIAFEQGVDEEGRPFLDCVDNGVGMGESELRGVFSRAGARFAEQLEFTLERAEWEALDPPVRLHPNSRFGIGVLSYFMLADEIRVTTCRMGQNGVPGPLLEVSICGPDHLFRIVRLSDRGHPGTTVRLFLRADVLPADWSAVDVLERLLGIAEFTTIARKGSRNSVWEPGVLRTRKVDPHREDFGLNAHGALVPCPDPPEDSQIIWCEHGGAVLVDGLLVGTNNRYGGKLVGAVVNLIGRRAPAQLSVDRREVIDDLRPVLDDLLSAGTDALMTSELPSFEWFCRVADFGVLLADLLGEALLAAGRGFADRAWRIDVAESGLFPGDPDLLRSGLIRGSGYSANGWTRRLGSLPDHIYLWRLLAHRPTRLLAQLTALCPEIDAVGPVHRARPSDQWLIYRRWGGGRTFMAAPLTLELRQLAGISETLRSTPPVIARRLLALGLVKTEPQRWSAAAPLTGELARGFVNTSLPAPGEPFPASDLLAAARDAEKSPAVVAARLREFGVLVTDEDVRVAHAALEGDGLLWKDPANSSLGCLDPQVPVSLGHVANVSRAFDLPVPEVRRRLAAYGLQIDQGPLPHRPAPAMTVLLSQDGDGRPPWLAPGERVVPEAVLRAAETLQLPVGQVVEQLAELGFAPSVPPPADASPADLPYLYDESAEAPARPPGPLSYDAVVEKTADLEELRHKLSRLRDYGFDIPLRVPDYPSRLDREILSGSGPFIWWRLPTDEPVPFNRVLLASRELGATPREIAGRLKAYGVGTSREDLPRGLTFIDALDLLRAHELEEYEPPEPGHFPLHYLHHAALERETSLTQVVSWLRQLGVAVPDPAETIRAALRRVPLA
ncbi:HD domain-containing protein [Streptomyces profundus]|uniref:wHTH domain-containing protein n=1 Tax=Streptomyces profundus TaxID=2867410 RepID=UPI001D16685D|nr:ATP-binding protein [Streptomyces sp. MA3_2.13]UED83820.1 ATP-binding protein [Streptomyces sp. MA3_2.13]